MSLSGTWQEWSMALGYLSLLALVLWGIFRSPTQS
jgi:hypothetical protein